MMINNFLKFVIFFSLFIFAINIVCAVEFIALNSTTTSSELTLTQGDTHAMRNSVASGDLWANSYSIKIPDTGKWYMEFDGFNASMGHGTIVGGLTGSVKTLSQSGNPVGWADFYGQYFHESSGGTVSGGSLIRNELTGTLDGSTVFQFKIDRDSNIFQFGRDGSWESGTATLGSGDLYLIVSVYHTGNHLHINTGQEAFAYAVPNGYNSGLYHGVLSSPPTVTNFTSSETTNFSAVNDTTNVTNITLAVNSKGKIKFPENIGINVDGADLDANIIIDDGLVFLNSSALDSSFNTTATLSFEGVDCSKPYVFYSESESTFDGVLKDNNRCVVPQCTNIQCNAGTLTVDVAHFTGYAAGANANLTIDAETGAKTTGEAIEFNASYVNATSGLAISGECNISFDDAWGTEFEMTYSSGVYYYNKSFGSSGTHWYNVTCYNASYNTLEATDSKLVTGSGVPEFNIWTVGIGLLVVVAGLYYKRKV